MGLNTSTDEESKGKFSVFLVAAMFVFNIIGVAVHTYLLAFQF